MDQQFAPSEAKRETPVQGSSGTTVDSDIAVIKSPTLGASVLFAGEYRPCRASMGPNEKLSLKHVQPTLFVGPMVDSGSIREALAEARETIAVIQEFNDDITALRDWGIDWYAKRDILRKYDCSGTKKARWFPGKLYYAIGECSNLVGEIPFGAIHLISGMITGEIWYLRRDVTQSEFREASDEVRTKTLTDWERELLDVQEYCSVGFSVSAAHHLIQIHQYAGSRTCYNERRRWVLSNIY